MLQPILRVKRQSILTTLLLLFLIMNSYAQDGMITGRPALAYWQAGKGKETVIVLHGGPGAAHDYLRPEWNALGQSARVIYYDQRGCGKSEKADCYSWREHVGDLKRVISQVAKGRKVVLAGSSWGATLALLYAYSFPVDVKALILSGTYNWIGKGQPAKDCIDYTPPAVFPYQRKDTFRYVPIKASTSPTTKEKFIESHTTSHSMAVNSMADAPTLARLGTIIQPVLIFKGKESCSETPVKEGADMYQAVLHNAQFYTIPGACHDPWLSHTDEFFSKANIFLRQLK